MFKKIFGGGKKKLSKLEKNIHEGAAQYKREMAERENSPAPTPAPQKPAEPGHEALLRHLDEKDAADPAARLQIAGKAIFQLACKSLEGLGGRQGVRVEDLLALLGSTGGYAVILSALTHLKTQGDTLEQAGIQHVGTADGKHFYFGDFPNHILVNHEMSVLGLSLGMVKHLGGEANFDLVNDAAAHVAKTIGTPEFGIPRLPEAHGPIMPPIEFITTMWPRIDQEIDRYQVAPLHKPAVIGFAIQNALQAGKDALDLAIAGKIIIECAVPMAKLDPAGIVYATNT